MNGAPIFVGAQPSKNTLPNWKVGEEEICVKQRVPIASVNNGLSGALLYTYGAGPTEGGTSCENVLPKAATKINKPRNSPKVFIISFSPFVKK